MALTEENKGLQLFFQGSALNVIREPKQVLSPRVDRRDVQNVNSEVYLVPNMRNGKIIGWVNLFSKELY